MKKVIKKTNNYNYSIQFLRFIFAIFLCLAHTVTVTALANYEQYTKIAPHVFGSFLAVAYFFIMSGFFLTFALKKNVEDFVVSRIIRLWPVLAFSILAMALFGPLHIEHTILRSEDIATLLFLQGTGISQEGNLNGVAWFTCILFWTSLIYFILLKILKKDLLIAIVVSLITILTGTLFILNFSLPIRDIIFGFVSIMMLYGLFCIGIGILASLFNKNILQKYINNISYDKSPGYLKIIFSILEFSILAYLCFFSLIKCNIFPYPANPILPILLFTILMLLFINKIGILSARILNNKLSSFLGNKSYSIYMMQTIVFVIINKMPPPRTTLPNTIFVLIYTTLLYLIIGFMTYYLVEKPAIKLFNKLQEGKSE